MKLTGKCKEAFEKWYCDVFRKGSEIPENHRSFWVDDMFYSSRTTSEQYGVYVDFFDSVGIQVSNRPYFDTFEWKVDMIDHEKKKVNTNSDAELTRHEARTAAIEKANELFNGH